MEKIKILHIIKSLGRGGAEMLLPETLKLHDTSRYEFHYIYFLPWKNQMVEALEKAGGKVTCFEAKNNIQLLWQYKKVVDYCREHEIELIHAHLPWAGFVARLVHQKTGIPTLYTEHNLQERYHVLTRRINKLSFNSQTLALGVSQDVTDSIKENIKPEIPVRTLLNGINTDSFMRVGDDQVRKQYGIPKGAVVIGTIAVFRFQKRLVEWLEAFKEIENQHQGVYGIIVGAGPLEEEVKKTHQILGLDGRVFFPGLQTDVKPFQEAMDIFMMSSSFEGLPLALLEAMSMNCAVVATRAGGIKEVIRDGQDGLTCEVDQWEELAPLCGRLINYPQEMERLKEAARKRVVEAFSLSTMVESLEEQYHRELHPTQKLHAVAE